jgi:NADH:ubiquinone oxidoreductase subunit 3 (subunit A)
LGLPGYGVLIVVILVVVFGLYPGLKNSYRIFVMTRDMRSSRMDATTTGEKDAAEQDVIDVEEPTHDDANEAPQKSNREQPEFTLSGEESQGIYQIWETYRVTTVTERMCWILLGVEVIFLFVWPTVALFSFGNYAIGALFMFIALSSALANILQRSHRLGGDWNTSTW